VIRLGDHVFNVAPGSTVLSAALAAGIQIPHSCGVGTCGTCRYELVDGEIENASAMAAAYASLVSTSNLKLACQSYPKTDLHIRLANDEECAFGNIIRQKVHTHDITQITVAVNRPIRFIPGQYAQIKVRDVGDFWRSFSFSQTCNEDGELSFLVRRVQGGRLSTALTTGNLRGAEVAIRGPFGDFWLRPGNERLVFVAGGSGIGPINAMLNEMVRLKDSRKCLLLFGVKTDKDVFFLEELRKLKSELGNTFEYEIWVESVQLGSFWSGYRGLVSKGLRSALTKEDILYICGSEGMVRACIDIALAVGIDLANLHSDAFVHFSTQHIPGHR